MISAELHCHSNYSDGKSPIEEILKYAKNIGLGAIAITDHDIGKGSKLAEKLAKKYDILVVPGIEISSNGHILVLGTNEEFAGDTLEIIDKIHSSGGIAIAAHPFGGIGSPEFKDREIIKNMDAIEAINGTSSFPWKNNKAIALAKKLKKPMTSGSDAHRLEELGIAACKIPANNVSGIIKAIKRGDVILPKNTSTFSVIKAKIKRRV